MRGACERGRRDDGSATAEFAAAVAAVLLVISLVVIVTFDLLQRRIARRG